MTELRSPLIIILGPTAVGKTEISIRLAERLNAEIVSADSRLLYRGMDIGTAKPSKDELARAPHHLIDVSDPDNTWSLAQYQEQAKTIINQIHQRGKLPLLVGGTGQYIRAITEGWMIPVVKPDLKLRMALENWTKEITPHGLHERLSMLDPQAAQNIEPRNLRRTIRALEVILATGKCFSSQRKLDNPTYNILQLGLTRPRPELYSRIDQRIEKMLRNGLVQEVENLLKQGYSPDLPTLSAIGYSEICQFLQGRISLEDAVVLIKRRTRMFVRRQANWFKSDDPNINWHTVSENTLAEMEDKIIGWLVKQEKPYF
jgi:tRNA dimethylallyltransferase